MNKQEFLDQLRRALSSRVEGAVVNEHMAYYEEYIATQIRMGKSEDEVISGLGDPRLLARSIADARKYEGSGFGADDTDSKEDKKGNPLMRNYRMPLWLILVIILAVIILVISAVFSVVTTLLPLLIPIAGIVFIFRLLKR